MAAASYDRRWKLYEEPETEAAETEAAEPEANHDAPYENVRTSLLSSRACSTF